LPGPLFPIQNFVAQPYAGSLQGINVSLLSRGGTMTNDGQTLSPGKTSRIVNVIIDFLSTQYKGQAVTINLQSGANSPPLSKILMVYVDNELNSQNVTIAFPDTQQYIGVPAFTTGYYPVLTGQLQAVIYNGSTGQVPITAQSQTSVIFCDFAIPGFLSQETLSVTFNGSNGPVVPTIGDQVKLGSLPIVMASGGTVSTVLLPAVAAPAQYVITGITVRATGLFIDATGIPQYLTFSLIDTATGIVIRQMTFFLTYSLIGQAFQYQILSQETGLNIPVQSLTLSSTAANAVPSIGVISASITYAEFTL
jgi:hypothetical protein